MTDLFIEVLMTEHLFLFCSLVLKFVDLEEEQEPINVKEVALRYKKEIETEVSSKGFCMFIIAVLK